MRIKQLSVSLENRPGSLHELTTGLAEINLRTLNVFEVGDTGERGIARIVVDDYDLAERTLDMLGYKFTEDTVLGLEISDKPGSVDKVLEILAEAKVNIQYLYGFVEKHEGKAVLIIGVPDEHIDLGVKALNDKGIYS